MIASLAGRVKLREAGRLIVDAGGVGYEVFIPLATYYRMPATGLPVELEIRQVVREDSITFYGFATPPEKRAFDLLLGVQHVGPKLALAILSVLSPEDLVDAITREDVDRIDAVPGVGPKVAERCVRELRDKISALDLVVSERPTAAANGHGGAPRSPTTRFPRWSTSATSRSKLSARWIRSVRTVRRRGSKL